MRVFYIAEGRRKNAASMGGVSYIPHVEDTIWREFRR